VLENAGYKTIGFRVAEACLQRETQAYIRAPIFLTSANKSGEEECHTIDEVNDVFRDNKDALKILPGEASCLPSSNVIQFV